MAGDPGFDWAMCFSNPITPCFILMSDEGLNKRLDTSIGPNEYGGERSATDVDSD